MVPEFSLPHSQVPATCLYPEPDQSNPCFLNSTSWRCILILSSHLRLGLLNGLLPSGFLPTRCMHLLLLPLKPQATPILLLIIRMKSGDGTGLEPPNYAISFWLLYSCPSHLRPTYFPGTFSLCFSLKWNWSRFVIYQMSSVATRKISEITSRKMNGFE